MKNRTLALILCGLILLPTAAACAEKTDDDQAKSTDAVTNAVTEEELSDYEKRQRIADNLPDENFDGDTFMVLARDRNDFVRDIGTDLESSGDVIETGLYERNTAVEQRFNIDIESDHAPDAITKLRASVQADEDAYDLMMDHAINIASAALEGNYLDWYEDLPYVNLEQPWYIGNAVDALSIDNHAYLMAGEYSLSILRFTYCMYFNKTIASNYNVDNLYELVNNGEWTADKLHEVTAGVYNDLNGNGKSDKDDQFGLVTDFYSAAINYQYAYDNPVMGKDSDGMPVITYLDGDKMTSIVDKVYSLFNENSGVRAETWGDSGPIWNAGHALFINNLFSSSESYRDLEFDFGIIPYPKWDTNQEAYYTMADGAHDLQAVPQTVGNTEMTSIIIEALNAESYKKVVPAYYEMAMKGKYTRDNESIVVLDQILAGRVFDFGYIYDGWQGYAFLLQDLTSSRSKNFASKVKSVQKRAEKRYEKMVDTMLGLIDT